jgi:hypothetical protein
MQSLRLPPRNIHKIELTAMSENHLYCVAQFGLQRDCKFGEVIDRFWSSKAISLRVLRCRLPMLSHPMHRLVKASEFYLGQHLKPPTFQPLFTP